MATKLPTEKSRFARTMMDYIVMFFGPPGVGKTTTVNELGRVLFLSTDRGTRFINAMRVECLSWRKFERTLEELEKPGAPHYDFIAIDHADDWASMAEDQVCRDFKIADLSAAGFGKGWKAYRDRMKTFCRRVMNLRTGVVFIAHEEIKKVTTRAVELDRTMPMLSKTAWKVLIPLADVVAYCGYRTIIIHKEGGKKKRKEIRTIETEPREDLYAKDRTDRKRPDQGWAPLDGKAFLATFEFQPTQPDEGSTEEKSDGQGQGKGQEVKERPRGRRARKQGD